MDVKKMIKGFFQDKFNVYLIIALLILGSGLFLFEHFQQSPPIPYSGDTNITVHFFYSQTCPHCHEQMQFNQKLMKEFPDVGWVYHDIAESSAQELYLQLLKDHGNGQTRILVPATFVGKEVFIGYSGEHVTGVKIREAIDYCSDVCVNQSVSTEKTEDVVPGITQVEVPFIGLIDITTLSLPVLAILLGLIDGFNPCAMWVLVYLIALVMELKDKKRIWFIVGTFLLASGILYFLFMTAWLNMFLFIGYLRPVMIIVGLVAIAGGTLSIKEYLEIRKAGGTLTCKVGDEEDHTKTLGAMQNVVSAPMSIATLGAIIILAFTVNSIEFVCSSAIPAVFTQVLALSNLPTLEYYLYIIMYVAAFMFDDLVIFSLAIFAVTSGIGEKYAKYCKIIGAVILFLLGIMLLFFPNLLI